MKYTLNDIAILQAELSYVDSRSECYPYLDNGMLPLFTAPMGSVVDSYNISIFEENHIISILPRTIPFNERVSNFLKNRWSAFSLSEFESIVDCKLTDGLIYYALIDIANGNMSKLHNLITEAKTIHGGKLQIMAGNIATPKAYEVLSNAGADYIRVGIGGGSVCITSSNTGVHYPMASLIMDCHSISANLKTPAKIVADGGIKGYGDIIKCLALGADYVMCGSIFNRLLESAGDTVNQNGEPIDQYSIMALRLLRDGGVIMKNHYGMSTKKAQIELGGDVIKTSEGIENTQRVTETISQWSNNLSDYLRSAMSYTGVRSLSEFIGNVETIIISNNSFNSINK